MVVDDKPLAIDLLADYIRKISGLELLYSTRNPLDALEYLRTNIVDLIFLDIQMPELTGLQFMNLKGEQGKVILTTAYAEHALEGYTYDVIDYLLKPIAFDRFCQAVEKARQRMSPQPQTPASVESGDSLFVKSDYRILRIPMDEILFIEARQNYIAIVTAKGKTLSLQNLGHIEERLSHIRFCRVHKSYIIAIDKIDSVERNRILIGEHVIPIGDNYKESFLRALGN